MRFGFNLQTIGPEGAETIAVRQLVLATGREGMALPRVPEPLRGFLGPQCWHSSADIDFAKMKGKVVAVLGFSASAVDNATAALARKSARTRTLVAAR